MKRRQLPATVLKSIAVGIVGSRSTAAQDDLDPVKLMPDTHKVIFENSFQQAVSVDAPASNIHSHPRRCAYGNNPICWADSDRACS